jgi:hypothetical protein
MGGKEDIAYENCQVVLAKFKELKYQIYVSRISRRAHVTWVEDNLPMFAPLLFK